MLLQGISQLVGLPLMMMMTCALNSNGQTGHQAVRPSHGQTMATQSARATGGRPADAKPKRLLKTYIYICIHIWNFMQLVRTTHNLLVVRLLATHVSRLLATYPFSTAHNSIRRCLALSARARWLSFCVRIFPSLSLLLSPHTYIAT